MTDHRGNPLSKELISQIRRLRLAGHSYREIATISGVAKSTIEIYCKHFPPTSAKGGPKTGRPPNTTEAKPLDDAKYGSKVVDTAVFEDDDDEPSALDLEADNWPEEDRT